MRIINTVLGKLRGAPDGADAELFNLLSNGFSRLNKLEPGLAKKVAVFVCTGEGESHLLTLESHAENAAQAMGLRDQYALGSSQTNALHSLFRGTRRWDVEAFCRLGRAFAAANAKVTGSEWGMAGSKKSPAWLRLLASMPNWMRSYDLQNSDKLGRFGNVDIDTCRAALKIAGESEFALLDIAIDPQFFYYQRHETEELMRGFTGYLRDNVEDASALAAQLAAPKRVDLIGYLGRTNLVDAYQSFIMAQAVASAKTVREAAQAALHGLSPEFLTEQISTLLDTGSAAERTQAAGFAVAVLGDRARPILEKHLEVEKGKRIRDAISAALTNLDLMADDPVPDGEPAPWGAAEDAGGDGFIALDGSPVDLPPMPDLPPDTPLAEEAIAHLRKAAEVFNNALRDFKAKADLKKQPWVDNWGSVSNSSISDYVAFLNGKSRTKQNAGYQDGIGTLLYWDPPFKFDKSHVDAFFNHPDTTVWHLLRDLSPSENQGRYWGASLLNIRNEYRSSPATRRLREMSDEGVDFRMLAAIWSRLGGTETLRVHMGSDWGRSLDAWQDTNLWQNFAENLDLIDEGLGMRPQSGDHAFYRMAAIEALQLFPKVPKRYLGALMDLATGTSKTFREPARKLLAGAPQIDDAIAALLTDGKQDTRAGAADWLADRKSASQIPALRTALKKEKSEIARAAILSALERLGDDISDQFSEEVLLAEAKKGLGKALPKALEWFPFDALPPVRWRDGSAINPEIVKWWIVLANKLKQPGGNALFDLYLERMKPEDAERLGQMVLRTWIAHDTVGPTEDEANAYAKQNADSTYKAYKTWDPSTTLESIFSMLKRSKLGEYHGSAIANKGVLALSVRTNGADMAEAAKSFLKNHGSRVAQCKAMIDCLGANPSPAAIQVVLATANRFKAKTVQAHAQAGIEEIAERRGWTADQLADRTIPTAGFDETGQMELDCGHERIYSVLYDTDGKVVLRNPSGKEVKSLPAARTEEETDLVKAAKKALSNARKEVKQVNTLQNSRLFEAMCTERLWDAGEWRDFVLRHPIAGRLAQRLVWLGLDGGGAVVASFRPLEDGSLSGPEDETIEIDTLTSVKLAHQSLVDDATGELWTSHLDDYEVEPLFPQFGRPLLELSEPQKKETEIDDRKGHMIETFRLRGAATKLGYERGEAMDGGSFMDYTKQYQGLGLIVAIEFSGSYLPEENIPAALTALKFRKIAKGGGSYGAGMKLGDVPAALLSESWNDFHEIAAAGTGYDADWERKGLF